MSCDRGVRQAAALLASSGVPPDQARAVWACRHLTVQESGDAFAIRHRAGQSKPALRLQGAWLAQAGFKPGDKVHVQVAQGQLVIQPQAAATAAAPAWAESVASAAPALAAAGIPAAQAQVAAQLPVWQHIPRCARCGRFLPTQRPVCVNPRCALQGQAQGAPVAWPPAGLTFKRSRVRAAAPPTPSAAERWTAHVAQLPTWTAQAAAGDTAAFYQSRAALAASLAAEARAVDADAAAAAPAGCAQALASERARLILTPDPTLSVAERSERLLALDAALGLLRAQDDLTEAQYRAALLDEVYRQTLPQSAAPVVWQPDRPVGCAAQAASQVDPAHKIEVRYRLVELEELITSNTPDGRINPAYNQDLQPRSRERAASRLQIEGIAQHLDADPLLRADADWGDGPPIVGDDGMVESGNGRALALRLAAEQHPAAYARYRAALAQRAAQFGLSAAAVQHLRQPVLVRERVSQLEPAARRRFVSEANASGAARMGAAEQARADAALLPPGFFRDLELAPSDETLGDALTRRANAPVVQRFFNLLPETERAALQDGQGGLSAEGVNRLERAVFAYALPGRAGARLADLVFEQGEAIDRVGEGIKRSLPRLALAEDLTRAGHRDAALSLGDDLATAVEKLRELRRQRLPVNDYLRQCKLFPELTPVQEQLLAQLDSARRSGRRVSDLLTAYADAVAAAPAPQQAALFAAARPDKPALLRRAIEQSGGAWIELAHFSAAQHAAAQSAPLAQVAAWTAPQQIAAWGEL